MAHGRNAEEFVHRVRHGGVDPMAALVSANSVGAEALGMAEEIGSIAPGLAADIIALDGDPLKDITAAMSITYPSLTDWRNQNHIFERIGLP